MLNNVFKRTGFGFSDSFYLATEKAGWLEVNQEKDNIKAILFG